MKSLIIFVAVLALVNADDGWEKCKPVVEKLKTCAMGKMEEAKKEMETFMDECKTCFDGKICKLPDFPKDPTPAPPSAESIECFKSSAANFGTCMKGKLGDSFDMSEMESHQKDGEKPKGGFGGHFRMPTKDELVKYSMQFCGNDENAAKTLRECGEAKAKNHAKLFASLMHPLTSFCKVKDECSVGNPISDECTEFLKKGAQAFCDCSTESKKSDSCKKQNPDSPHQDDHQPDFDFCKLDFKKDFCADAAKIEAEMKPKFAATSTSNGDDQAKKGEGLKGKLATLQTKVKEIKKGRQ